MASQFRLRIVTPEQSVLDQEVTSVEALAVEGWLGVWANHAPMVALLLSGDVKWRDADGEEHALAITGGILDVGENQARIIADGLAGEPPPESASSAASTDDEA
jgi:F-type H+-transporting ATPase subunit epsilon